jgi:hypothetical protein
MDALYELYDDEQHGNAAYEYAAHDAGTYDGNGKGYGRRTA